MTVKSTHHSVQTFSEFGNCWLRMRSREKEKLCATRCDCCHFRRCLKVSISAKTRSVNHWITLKQRCSFSRWPYGTSEYDLFSSPSGYPKWHKSRRRLQPNRLIPFFLFFHWHQTLWKKTKKNQPLKAKLLYVYTVPLYIFSILL